ncbi:hypothetical protein WN51_03835 [Melipona quadrifasciata]|uniref:Uncharacterized protein n=1 Tax=Melipona quadrifasciata TaxID=166423 RepID=A0A0M9AD20_9HYME|nr:hypothetical protein WN51_03835 [Melipona quadrifasciata]
MYIKRKREELEPWMRLAHRSCATDRDLHTPTQSSKALQIFRISGLRPCDKQEAATHITLLIISSL